MMVKGVVLIYLRPKIASKHCFLTHQFWYNQVLVAEKEIFEGPKNVFSLCKGKKHSSSIFVSNC